VKYDQKSQKSGLKTFKSDVKSLKSSKSDVKSLEFKPFKSDLKCLKCSPNSTKLDFESLKSLTPDLTGLHGKKGFVILTKSFVKIGITKTFCCNSKRFSSVKTTFGCCSKIFGCSNKKILLSLILLP